MGFQQVVTEAMSGMTELVRQRYDVSNLELLKGQACLAFDKPDGQPGEEVELDVEGVDAIIELDDSDMMLVTLHDPTQLRVMARVADYSVHHREWRPIEAILQFHESDVPRVRAWIEGWDAKEMELLMGVSTRRVRQRRST